MKQGLYEQMIETIGPANHFWPRLDLLDKPIMKQQVIEVICMVLLMKVNGMR